MDTRRPFSVTSVLANIPYQCTRQIQMPTKHRHTGRTVYNPQQQHIQPPASTETCKDIPETRHKHVKPKEYPTTSRHRPNPDRPNSTSLPILSSAAIKGTKIHHVWTQIGVQYFITECVIAITQHVRSIQSSPCSSASPATRQGRFTLRTNVRIPTA